MKALEKKTLSVDMTAPHFEYGTGDRQRRRLVVRSQLI